MSPCWSSRALWPARGGGSLRARVQSAFRMGSGGKRYQFTCAPADGAVERGGSFSHVRADFRPSLEQRAQMSIRIGAEADPKRPSQGIVAGGPMQAGGGVGAEPRPSTRQRPPDLHATGPIRDHPHQGFGCPAPATADTGADGPAVSCPQSRPPQTRPPPGLVQSRPLPLGLRLLSRPRPAARPRRSRRPRPRSRS